MIPPHWNSNLKKPICRVCGCVEFNSDMICQGCEEPLVFRAPAKKPIVQAIAAQRWQGHWPKDYKKRCFLCGWKSRKTLEDLIPGELEEIMAAGIWASTSNAQRLLKIMCPNREVSNRIKTIIGVVAHSGKNILFSVKANKIYAKMAEEYEQQDLFFCRQCAEKDNPIKDTKDSPINSVSLTNTIADSMNKAVNSKIQEPIKEIPKKILLQKLEQTSWEDLNQEPAETSENWGMDDNWNEEDINSDEENTDSDEENTDNDEEYYESTDW